MSDQKVVPFKIVPKAEPTEDEIAQERASEHEKVIASLKDDGPFEWFVGIGRKKDGTIINFGTSMQLSDLVFASAVLHTIAHGTMEAMLLSDE